MSRRAAKPVPRAPASPYAVMLLGSLAFAVMATLAHALGARCDWRVVALARTGLALAFAVALAVAAGVRLALWRPPTLWLRSTAGSVGLLCTFYALPRLPVADVLTLTNMFPVWVALLSWPVLGERPPPRTWLLVGCGVLGVALVQQPHLAEGNFAVFAALAASLSTAVAMLGLHRLRGLDARAILVHFAAVSVLFCLGFLAFSGEVAPPPWEVPGLLMLLGVGLSATLGQLCLTRAFTAGPPTRVSVVGLSQVAFGAALDALVWGRAFDPVTLIGMVLVLAPTAWLLAQRGTEPPPE